MPGQRASESQRDAAVIFSAELGRECNRVDILCFVRYFLHLDGLGAINSYQVSMYHGIVVFGFRLVQFSGSCETQMLD